MMNEMVGRMKAAHANSKGTLRMKKQWITKNIEMRPTKTIFPA